VECLTRLACEDVPRQTRAQSPRPASPRRSGIAQRFSLIPVVVGGAELFTGNAMLIMAWAGRKLAGRRLLANWAIVYVANLVGALRTAGLVPQRAVCRRARRRRRRRARDRGAQGSTRLHAGRRARNAL